MNLDNLSKILEEYYGGKINVQVDAVAGGNTNWRVSGSNNNHVYDYEGNSYTELKDYIKMMSSMAGDKDLGNKDTNNSNSNVNEQTTNEHLLAFTPSGDSYTNLNSLMYQLGSAAGECHKVGYNKIVLKNVNQIDYKIYDEFIETIEERGMSTQHDQDRNTTIIALNGK